jgi:hypothetical protein
MQTPVGKQVADVQRLTVPQLRTRYAEVFGEATATKNRLWLVKRLAWRPQALAEGDLPERARQRAAELANDAELRMSPPRLPAPGAPPERTSTRPVRFPQDNRLPPPGTVLTRPYKGRTLLVKVLPTGFEYEGQTYGSLSAVAKQITGSHCNGFLFFRLNTNGDHR